MFQIGSKREHKRELRHLFASACHMEKNVVIKSIIYGTGCLENIFVKKLRGISPQTNYVYSDRATIACRRSWCQLLRIEGVAWSE
jgi:hypothetical protein